jgi:hypothetical protein
MRYFKRIYSEVITRFNKDWSAVDAYYFEVNETNYVEKQIVKNYEGKVFKYDNNNLQDENGGLAEGALDLQEEQYEQITKEAFYALWDKPFTNTYLVKQLAFDDHWKFAWYNIDYNTTEQELYDGNLILCGTYKDVYLLEVEFSEHSNYLFYKINEGSANIKYGTVDNWDELVSCVQLWINYIEKNAGIIYSKPESEKIERTMKVLVDGTLQDATFSVYRNMDWDIEKFRAAYLKTANEKFAHINTYIGVEDLLIKLQEGLPENVLIQSCLFCRFSNYMVAGNDNFADLNCFKHCKDKCNSLKTKNDIIDMFESELSKSEKVEETFYCEEFEAIQENDYVFKSQIK